jgi:hypothetical protein
VSATGERPVFRVIAGDATAEELAAVVAAVAASGLAGGGAPADDGTTSIWAARGYGHRHIRATFTPSPHGWRTSFWPR